MHYRFQKEDFEEKVSMSCADGEFMAITRVIHQVLGAGAYVKGPELECTGERIQLSAINGRGYESFRILLLTAR